MKTGKGDLWRSPWPRRFAAALACLMILAVAAPAPELAFAEEVPGAGQETEAGPEDPGLPESSQPSADGDGEEGQDPGTPQDPGEDDAPPDTPDPDESQGPDESRDPAASQPDDPAQGGGEGGGLPEEDPSRPAGPDEDEPQPPVQDPVPPAGPDAGPGAPDSPSADPSAPGATAPEAPWSCPHNSGDSCDLCVVAWKWVEDANLEGAMVWVEDEEPEEAPGESQAPEGDQDAGGDKDSGQGQDPGEPRPGKWVLGLPGLGEEPLTWDLLLPLLPQEVEAALASGAVKALPLVWDVDANLEGAMAPGGLVVTATLDPAAGDYALTPAAPKLEVLVAAGGGEGYVTYPTLWMKFLNKWYFFGGLDDEGNEQNVLDETATITVAINDLQHKTKAQILQWIQDTGLLPKRIGGWVPNDIIPSGQTWNQANENGYIRLPTLGFVQNTKKTDPFIEIKEVPAGSGIFKNEEYTSGAQWGSFPIDEWDFTNIPAGPYNDGEKITIVARTINKEGPNKTRQYRAFVNSNNLNDYPGKNDTYQNPDILTLNIKLVNIDPDKHIVEPADPGNVKVNLFDYWVADYGQEPKAPQGDILPVSDEHLRGDRDDPTIPGTNRHKLSAKEDWYTGINEGHLLIFGDGVIHAGLWNKGAGEMTPYGKAYAGMEEIVRSVLVDGYPVINTAAAEKQLTGVTDPSDENYRDYTKIGDYKLAGDHYDAGYTGTDIQNLSKTLIQAWENSTGQTFSEDTLESLDYLFDPDKTHPNKKTYTDVKGLFQLDEKGNYYYNMRDNFAEFVQGTQTDPEKPGYDPNHFILYDNGATTRTDGDKSIGNFFPFNKGSEVFNTLDGNKLGSTVDCARNAMNHHLGMTVEVDFRQPNNGMINTGSGKGDPMTFQFSGDDDVWVFVDDVLVLDLGGTHSEIYGTINFATGDIYIGRAFDSKGIPDDPAASDRMVTHTTLRKQYEKAALDNTKVTLGETQWNGETFASNTSHTLKMFYLERGNYDSSIALNFNLQPLLHQRIVKVDQYGQPRPGVEFELYEASDRDANGKKFDANTPGAIQCLYTDRDLDKNTQDTDPSLENKVFYVKKKDNAKLLVELTTQSDGSAVFMTADGQYFNFADRGDQYYILEETKEPAGYRKQPVPIVLGYDTSTSMLSVANRWTTGAYACSVSNVTAAANLNYGKVEGETIVPDSSKPVGNDDQEKGLVVAIPMMKKKSDKSWMALYGSNLDSFQAVPIDKNTVATLGVEAAWKEAAAMAILNQAKKRNTADWHLDWDDGNRRLHGTLFDLPGLANRYLLNNPDGDIQMIYGFLDSQALDKLGIHKDTAKDRYAALRDLVEAKGVEATYQLLSLDEFKFLSVKQFNRDFRSLIYIPNERRELRVLKIDQDGEPLAGTVFGLFFNDEKTPRASGKTDQNGMLVFSPAGDNTIDGQAQAVWANAQDGQYYLKEMTPPTGYKVNDTKINIKVGTYSIYADAGTENDGVSVMAGAGTLTQTMHQYAASQKVDVTLQDILAVMQVQESGSFHLDGWQDAKLEGTNVLRTMNLHYKKNNPEGQDYGLHDEDGGAYFTPYFVTDTGYVRTRIQQNWPALIGDLGYAAADPDANMENLGDTDLTNLFSMVNMVVVGDRADAPITTGSLTISKTVAGEVLDDSDYTQLFRFKVELTAPDGTPLEDTFEYHFYGDDKTGKIKNGGELLLHHDEAVAILGLPQGTKYTVTEEPEAGWYPDPADRVHSGTIPVDPDQKNVTVAPPARFTNSRQKPEDPPPSSSSGSSSSSAPPGGGDDDDGDDSSSAPPPDGSSVTSRKHPGTGDETDTESWASLSVLFLVGAVAICLARFRRKKDPSAEDPRSPGDEG